MGEIVEHLFDTADAAAQALADAVAEQLRAGITARRTASLIVSGGRSPLAFFHALRVQALDWSRVVVTLADERWVDPQSADSNEKLVREHLLRDAAAAATFVSLKTDDARPLLAVAQISERLGRVPRPFDAVVLGMGADGHTASLFPGMPAIEAALNPGWALSVVSATAPQPPVERVSLTLRALIDARNLYLAIGGAAKAAVYEAARDRRIDVPVGALLRHARVPVQVMLSAT